MIYKIGDIGSNHMNKLEYAKEAIQVAKDSGLDCVKFQLFNEANNGNIKLEPQYLYELKYIADKLNIDFLCSVFDVESFNLYMKIKPTTIKLAYSQAFNLELIKLSKKNDLKIIASGDLVNYPDYADIKLYCIPEYPVRKFMTSGNADIHFDGLSSHYLGSYIDVSLMKNDTWSHIEKHFTLDHDDISCPDNEFALSPKDLKKWVDEINKI